MFACVISNKSRPTSKCNEGEATSIDFLKPGHFDPTHMLKACIFQARITKETKAKISRSCLHLLLVFIPKPVPSQAG